MHDWEGVKLTITITITITSLSLSLSHNLFRDAVGVLTSSVFALRSARGLCGPASVNPMPKNRKVKEIQSSTEPSMSMSALDDDMIDDGEEDDGILG